MVLGEEESVLFREVSLFQGCLYRGVPLYINYSFPVSCWFSKFFGGSGVPWFLSESKVYLHWSELISLIRTPLFPLSVLINVYLFLR